MSRSPSVVPDCLLETLVTSDSSIKPQLPGSPKATTRRIDPAKLLQGSAVVAAQTKLQEMEMEMEVDASMVEYLMSAIRPTQLENLTWAQASVDIAGVILDSVSKELEASRKQMEKSQKAVTAIANKIDSLTKQNLIGSELQDLSMRD
ncbi:hypothetical protein BU15DRAFT_79529 [Melanogaster broomeanus]|nr:hypothetical protein BU15DRAFT_79529 [Melanogaster broomeanus]